MDYFLLSGALAGALLIWWIWSSLSWIEKQDKAKVAFADAVQRERKARRKEIYRGGFGRNIFQGKAKRQAVERQIDAVIEAAKREAGKAP